ncbi:MAG: ATP synthase subunit delta [Chloroflexota bacterium]|nr:MAG: ATP synthase subunit delta [Chloroflexota bacterium]
MSSTDPKTQALARTYAEAIFGLAEERKQGDALVEEMAEVEALMAQDAVFSAYLTDPEVDAKHRAGVIEKSFRGRLTDLLTDALLVINAKGRMNLLPLIFSSCREAHEQAREVAKVEIVTAVALTEELRAALTAAAGAYAGRAVRLVETIDPELLGGLVLRVGDVKLDTSLSRHLARLHDLMFEHGDRAIHGESEKRFIEGALV